MRGRKPKPTAFKVLHGSDQPRNPHEPRATGDLADCPADFDDDQRAIWDEAVRSAPPGLLKSLDSSVLEVWAANVDRRRRAQRQLAEQTDGLGGPNSKRLLVVISRAEQMIVRCSGELGFSPTSRPRASVSATTWRPGPAVITDDDSPRESIEEYIARGEAMNAASRAKASRRPN